MRKECRIETSAWKTLALASDRWACGINQWTQLCLTDQRARKVCVCACGHVCVRVCTTCVVGANPSVFLTLPPSFFWLFPQSPLPAPLWSRDGKMQSASDVGQSVSQFFWKVVQSELIRVWRWTRCTSRLVVLCNNTDQPGFADELRFVLVNMDVKRLPKM